MSVRFAHKQFQTAPLGLHRKDEDILPAQAKQSQHSLVALQRYVGNAGVQRLMKTPSINLHTQTSMLHRKGCGCPSCGVKQEEQTNPASPVVQRFWGDEEESESEGGSWLDSAANEVSSWVSGDESDSSSSSNSSGGSSWFGGEEEDEYQETEQEEHHEQQSETESNESSETDSEEGGSWFDDAVDTVKDWFSDDEESESESSESSGGMLDWIDDWWSDEGSEASESESSDDVQHTEEEISYGHGTCVTPIVGHGGGSSGGVSVAGLTSANFSHNKSYGYAGGGAYTNKEGERVEDITIDLTVTYTSNPQIDFTITPDYSTLSECKQAAVDAYKAPSGLLGKHEQEHVNKFKTYDGSEKKKFKVTVPADSAASEAETKAEEKATELNDAREQAARDKSDLLDPWSKAIPNIENCVDPPAPDTDSESESESE